MRSQPGFLRRLPVFCVLLFFWGSTGLCAFAIFLGRSTQDPPAQGFVGRTLAPPPVGFNYCGVRDARRVPIILDPETGAIEPCTRPDLRDLLLLGFSPWRDVNGQYQLIALKRHVSGGRDEGDGCADEPFGLMRYTYPDGKVVGRVPFDSIPWGPVCWFPDRTDRILFVGEDSGLFLYDFDARSGSRSLGRAPRPRPLRWQGVSPGVGPVRFQDPCWPSTPELGGRLLVSTYIAEDASGPYRDPQLWSLQLDPDQATIVSADRMIVPDGDRSGLDQEEQRMPCVQTAPDGTPLLAYLARTPGRSNWDLWVAPITFNGSSRTPRVLQSARRKLTEGCAGLGLAFSADGRTIHVSMRDESQAFPIWGMLRSYPVPAGLSGP